MKSRVMFRAAMAAFICGTVLVSGCRKPKATVDGSDMLSGRGIETYGDLPMGGERTPDGIRVTDPAAQIEAVSFGFDSYQIAPAEMPKIGKAADFMKNNPDVRLVAEGHCDERGSNEYNMSLGEHRAQAIRAALVSAGIEATRIQTRSFGEENPIDPGHNEAAWSVNRRGEFAFYRD
jgi:peptidoglycan-associated lipoprotein